MAAPPPHHMRLGSPSSAVFKKKHILFTPTDRRLFQKIVKKFTEIIENKSGSCVNRERKYAAWVRITNLYNASSHQSEKVTIKQLKCLWTNMKMFRARSDKRTASGTACETRHELSTDTPDETAASTSSVFNVKTEVDVNEGPSSDEFCSVEPLMSPALPVLATSDSDLLFNASDRKLLLKAVIDESEQTGIVDLSENNAAWSHITDVATEQQNGRADAAILMGSTIDGDPRFFDIIGMESPEDADLEVHRRRALFTTTDRELFRSVISNFKHIIDSKITNRNMWLKKSEAWSRVTVIYNESPYRSERVTEKQLKKLWYNMKGIAKDAKLTENDAKGGPSNRNTIPKPDAIVVSDNIHDACTELPLQRSTHVRSDVRPCQRLLFNADEEVRIRDRALFTTSDRELLRSVISNFKHIVDSKTSNRHMWIKKSKAWSRITDIYNSSPYRSERVTDKQLKKLWTGMKRIARDAKLTENNVKGDQINLDAINIAVPDTVFKPEIISEPDTIIEHENISEPVTVVESVTIPEPDAISEPDTIPETDTIAAKISTEAQDEIHFDDVLPYRPFIVTAGTKHLLLRTISNFKDIIESQQTGNAIRWKKKKAWSHVTNIYNTSPHISQQATTAQLKKVWKSMKCRTKRGLSNNSEICTSVSCNTVREETVRDPLILLEEQEPGVKIEDSVWRRSRRAVFTSDDKELFRNVIKNFKHIIDSKIANVHIWQKKKIAWSRITNIYNASPYRSKRVSEQQLRKLWTNMRRNGRDRILPGKNAKENPSNLNTINISVADTIPEPNTIPEPDTIPESDTVSELDTIPEPDTISESDTIPEPDNIPELNSIAEADTIPDVCSESPLQGKTHLGGAVHPCRRLVFTARAMRLLIIAISYFRDIIESEDTDNATRSEQNVAWSRVTDIYNASQNKFQQATAAQLKNMWYRMKYKARQGLDMSEDSVTLLEEQEPSVKVEVDRKRFRRRAFFTANDKELFRSVISKFKHIVDSKITQSHYWFKKKKAWSRITDIYNASPHRSEQVTEKQLKKLWAHMKHNARVKLTGTNTEGDPRNLDAIDITVLDTMPELDTVTDPHAISASDTIPVPDTISEPDSVPETDFITEPVTIAGPDTVAEPDTIVETDTIPDVCTKSLPQSMSHFFGMRPYRRLVFTARTRKQLLNAISNFKDIIESKEYNSAMRWKKNQAWSCVTDIYNKSQHRSQQATTVQLRNLWSSMKHRANAPSRLWTELDKSESLSAASLSYHDTSEDALNSLEEQAPSVKIEDCLSEEPDIIPTEPEITECLCCCLSQRSEECQWDSCDQRYQDMIRRCFNINVVSLSTSKICNTCVARLQDACFFKLLVLSSQKHLAEKQNIIADASIHSQLDEMTIALMRKEEVALAESHSLSADIQCDSADIHSVSADIQCDSADIHSVSADIQCDSADKHSVSTDIQYDSADIHDDSMGIRSKTADIHCTKEDTRNNSDVFVPSKENKLVRTEQSRTSTIFDLIDDLSYVKDPPLGWIEEEDAHLQNALTILACSNATPFINCTGKGYKCYYCLQYIIDPELLRQHSRQNHTNERKRVLRKKRGDYYINLDVKDLTCELCSQQMDNLDALTTHLTEIHNETYISEFGSRNIPFILNNDLQNCQKCNRVFTSFRALVIHMNSHFNHNICETCGEGFINKTSLRYHVETRHSDKQYQCNYCNKTFTNAITMKAHENNTHKLSTRFTCPKCLQRFYTYKERLQHLTDSHGVAPVIHRCKFCKRRFINSSKLGLHIKRVHLKEKRYSCKYCFHKFFDKISYEGHMKAHIGEKKYHCVVCGKSYPHANGFVRHVETHNNERYECDVCGKSYSQKCTLSLHMRTNHPHIT